MKKKKSLLSLGLLALVLVLGVGYAVVTSQTLTISGSASTVDGGKIDVYFSEVSENVVTSGSDTVTAEGSITSDLVATINVTGLAAVGDSAEITYTVSNREKDLAADVLKKNITVLAEDGKTDLSSYFEVTTSVDSDAVRVANNNGTTDGTAEITVTVELVKLPIDESDSTANISIEFEASPVQPN